MTYKRDNNDPDRTKTVLSPEEVKAMLLGGGDPAADEQPAEIAAIFSSPAARILTPAEYERAKAQSAGRCPTCGRAFDCACGDDCDFCVGGVPTLSDEEYYAPTGR